MIKFNDILTIVLTIITLTLTVMTVMNVIAFTGFYLYSFVVMIYLILCICIYLYTFLYQFLLCYFVNIIYMGGAAVCRVYACSFTYYTNLYIFIYFVSVVTHALHNHEYVITISIIHSIRYYKYYSIILFQLSTDIGQQLSQITNIVLVVYVLILI